MRLLSALLTSVLVLGCSVIHAEDKPLRVFIRAGVKTHGPGQHDHPRFLTEWTALLNERGMKADGALNFPTPEQLANTDVLIFYCADGANILPEQRPHLLEFTKRGGGIVVIHDAIVASKDPEFFQQIVGGVWQNGKAKWYEGEVGIYFQDREHPVTKGMANFDSHDEIYYSLNMLPEARILASSFHDVFNIAPQIWSYEKDNYRAIVSIPGHNHTTFSLPHYRTLLLRAIAWTGKRENVDMYAKPEELASIEYPEGGPQRPEKSLAKMDIHPDFNMSLTVSEPLVNKPMNMDWDPKGRMWVAETPEYPQGKKKTRTSIMEGRGYKAPMTLEERPGYDRISVLEDTNGDGIADKKTVFADDLELVTGLVFHKDGVIVTQAPEIIWLRDTDGDGKCDKRETLYTGLGNGDTHAVINNPRWGYDGWIYATHGYSGGTVKTADGKTSVGIGSGVCRFKPDGSAIEMYSSKGGNTWGLDITWDNEVFFTQPTSGDLLMHVVLPEYVLAKGKVGKTPSFKALITNRPSIPAMTYKRQAYVQIDQVGRFTASAGCAIYGGGSWPEEWNYNYFTTEPTINIIHQEVVNPAGPTYTSAKNREPEFISGKDYWFRPIETRIGPDGALYIIDFYNQAVVHNDTRGPYHAPRNFALRPDRDHYYGRIWRVDHKQAKKLSVPDLSKAAPAELVKALDHANLHVRNNAMRLLWERGDDAAFGELAKLVADNAKPATARIPALWALYNAKKLNAETLTAAINSPDLAVRKNGVRAANNSGLDVKSALVAKLKDEDARVRLEAIVSLSSMTIDKTVTTALLEAYPSMTDNWSQSALIALSKNDPVLFCEGAFGLADATAAEGLLANLAGQAAASEKPDAAARLVKIAAEQPAAKDAMKVAVLTALSRSGKDAVWSDEVKVALKTLLNSENALVTNAALSLVGRWDKQGTLAEDVKARLQKVQAALADANASDDQRAELVRTLLSLQKQDPSVLSTVGQLLGGPGSPAFKKQVVIALGAVPELEAGKQLIAVLGKLPAEALQSAIDELVKRDDWSNALLDAIKTEKVKLTALGPVNVHRLRTHPEKAIAKRANDIVDELRGPEMKEKNELLAKLIPAVEKPGDAVKGKQVFIQNCAACHRFGNDGRDVGPVLNGMGAHGPAELLVSIIDPNRAVEPSYLQWMVRTNSGETFDGVVVESIKSLTLRNAAGEREVKYSDIKTRTNTGLSLMPNGFEALGEEALRDLLAYMCSADQKYRIVDLTDAFTTDSRKGLYISQTNPNDTLKFNKFGVAEVDGIPFNIVAPEKSRTGKNLIVLKGGPGGSYSSKLPQRVEAKGGFAAKKLHFLGGVAGWGFPAVDEKVPVLKVTVHYAGGGTEELVFSNGQEFADYIKPVDVPGSKLTKGLVKENQLRWFSKELKNGGVIEKIVLESYGNGVAPTLVSITAELQPK